MASGICRYGILCWSQMTSESKPLAPEADVIATSSAEKKDFLLSLGADEHIDYKEQRFEDHVADVDLVP